MCCFWPMSSAWLIRPAQMNSLSSVEEYIFDFGAGLVVCLAVLADTFIFYHCGT